MPSRRERFGSPSDSDPGQAPDAAYVARHKGGGRVAVHIAGIHAVGSLGATHYLTAHLAEVYAQTGDRPFSMVIQASYDRLTITGSKLTAGPYLW